MTLRDPTEGCIVFRVELDPSVSARTAKRAARSALRAVREALAKTYDEPGLFRFVDVEVVYPPITERKLPQQ